MAYVSSANRPYLMTPGALARPQSTSIGIQPSLWGYASTDPLATVIGSSYFSDGYNLGLRKWDSILHTDVNSTIASLITVTSVSTASGGVTASSLLTT